MHAGVTRSYVRPAVVVLVLYVVLWFPGLIARSYVKPPVALMLFLVLWLPGLTANIVYWRAAERDERVAGRAPQGKGCLEALLWIFVIFPIVLGVFIGLLVIVIAWRSD